MNLSGSESDAARRLLAPLTARPERSAVLCDVDGTLAPIVVRPEDAAVPERARDLLRAILERYAIVGFISGRLAIDARRIVGIDAVAYAGNHGLEYLPPGADRPERLRPPAAGEREAGAFVRAAYTPALQGVGVRLEDKDPIWSLHWREAADEEAARRAVERVAGKAERRGLMIHWGRKILEVRPMLTTDKGTVLETMLDKTEVDAALYAGDDLTDLDAFRALRELRSRGELQHAVCIGVRSDEGPPQVVREADLVVEGTAGFAQLLSLLVPRSRG